MPQVAGPAFPQIQPKPHLVTECVLEHQIYVIDDFLSAKEVDQMLKFTSKLELEGPKRPGRGEAERTGHRIAIPSPSFAAHLLDALAPHLASFLPPPSFRLLVSSPASIASIAECSSNIRIYRYPTNSFFGPHYDVPTPSTDPQSRRESAWTVLVYLTGEDSGVQGGGTVFHFGDPTPKKTGKAKKPIKPSVRVAPRSGRLMVHWHGDAGGGCMLHEGERVAQGEKWVLRSDVLF